MSKNDNGVQWVPTVHIRWRAGQLMQLYQGSEIQKTEEGFEYLVATKVEWRVVEEIEEGEL